MTCSDQFLGMATWRFRRRPRLGGGGMKCGPRTLTFRRTASRTHNNPEEPIAVLGTMLFRVLLHDDCRSSAHLGITALIGTHTVTILS
jgi:hypothetical protein